jgi:hypothetical protein
MKTLHTDFYGDTFRWFMGVVVNNKDPIALGRLQVRVYGLHTSDLSDIPTRDLPWAQVVVPSTEGGISGLGRMPRIQNGAQVVGFFLDGASSQIPLVLGSIHTIEGINPGVEASLAKCDVSGNVLSNNTSQAVHNSSRAYSKMTAASPGSTELVGGGNGEKIYNFFLANGLTPNQAVGVIGNFAAESNLNPGAYNPNDVGKPAFGLAQWRASRYSELRMFSGENDLDYKTLEAQLQFTIYELNKYPYLGYSQLKSSSTVYEATKIFEEKFERPQPGTFNKRLSYAKQAFEEYNS